MQNVPGTKGQIPYYGLRECAVNNGNIYWYSNHFSNNSNLGENDEQSNESSIYKRSVQQSVGGAQTNVPEETLVTSSVIKTLVPGPKVISQMIDFLKWERVIVIYEEDTCKSCYRVFILGK